MINTAYICRNPILFIPPSPPCPCTHTCEYILERKMCGSAKIFLYFYVCMHEISVSISAYVLVDQHLHLHLYLYPLCIYLSTYQLHFGKKPVCFVISLTVISKSVFAVHVPFIFIQQRYACVDVCADVYLSLLPVAFRRAGRFLCWHDTRIRERKGCMQTFWYVHR